MAPYELLYGRKCRTPVCWGEVGQRELAPSDLIAVTNEKIKLLRKCLADETTLVPLDDIELDEALNYVERPIAIKDVKVKNLRNKAARQVLVQWQHRKGSELTWEAEDEMRKHYPFLFGVKEEGTSTKKTEGAQDRGYSD
ncbi:uncharacterized protein LOC110907627 [Helianthus annuus]|uniref:uncharacterized protein LOC110907627 n=1 Tax=Helianthus annuus TaxID=4232 RepID=UPI000B8F4AB1|nr:uncharacterized protein LOC110907627 [Helianthus annuus]